MKLVVKKKELALALRSMPSVGSSQFKNNLGTPKRTLSQEEKDTIEVNRLQALLHRRVVNKGAGLF